MKIVRSLRITHGLMCCFYGIAHSMENLDVCNTGLFVVCDNGAFGASTSITPSPSLGRVQLTHPIWTRRHEQNQIPESAQKKSYPPKTQKGDGEKTRHLSPVLIKTQTKIPYLLSSGPPNLPGAEVLPLKAGQVLHDSLHPFLAPGLESSSQGMGERSGGDAALP